MAEFLDIDHALEHVSACGNVLYGSGSALAGSGDGEYLDRGAQELGGEAVEADGSGLEAIAGEAHGGHFGRFSTPTNGHTAGNTTTKFLHTPLCMPS